MEESQQEYYLARIKLSDNNPKKQQPMLESFLPLLSNNPVWQTEGSNHPQLHPYVGIVVALLLTKRKTRKDVALAIFLSNAARCSSVVAAHISYRITEGAATPIQYFLAFKPRHPSNMMERTVKPPKGRSKVVPFFKLQEDVTRVFLRPFDVAVEGCDIAHGLLGHVRRDASVGNLTGLVLASEVDGVRLWLKTFLLRKDDPLSISDLIATATDWGTMCMAIFNAFEGPPAMRKLMKIFFTDLPHVDLIRKLCTHSSIVMTNPRSCVEPFLVGRCVFTHLLETKAPMDIIESYLVRFEVRTSELMFIDTLRATRADVLELLIHGASLAPDRRLDTIEPKLTLEGVSQCYGDLDCCKVLLKAFPSQEVATFVLGGVLQSDTLDTLRCLHRHSNWYASKDALDNYYFSVHGQPPCHIIRFCVNNRSSKCLEYLCVEVGLMPPGPEMFEQMIENNDVDMLRLMHSRFGADFDRPINAQQEYPIHVAVRHFPALFNWSPDHRVTLRYLVEEVKVDLDVLTNEGWTPQEMAKQLQRSGPSTMISMERKRRKEEAAAASAAAGSVDAGIGTSDIPSNTSVIPHEVPSQ